MPQLIKKSLAVSTMLTSLHPPLSKHVFFLPAFRILLCAAWIQLLFAISPAITQANPLQPAKFTVFDATKYKGKPDLSHFGIIPATIIYTSSLWHEGESIDRPPALLHVWDAARMSRDSSDLMILDVEYWPLKGDTATVNSSLSKYKALLDTFRSHAHGKSIGYYGLPVGRDFWRVIAGTESNEYKEWQKENDAVKPLAVDLDVSLPSLYTFYPDQPSWVAFAVANIAEARRINPGKPVYAFLWPRFHDSNKLLGGRPIPADFWKLQLETVRHYADGVVIWGGWGEDGEGMPAEWKDEAEWWKVTKAFINSIQ